MGITMTSKQLSKHLDSLIKKWMDANPGAMLTEEQLIDDYRCGQLILTDKEEDALIIAAGL